MKSKGLSGSGVFQILAILSIAAWPLLPARAQSIFSANALGYVDVSFVAGSNLIANPLFADDNSVSNLLRDVPNGSYFIPWNRSSQRFEPTNHYTAGGWTYPVATFVAPDGGFLVLPSAHSLSFVGQPWPATSGPGCLTYPGGDSVFGWLPTTCCAFDCDVLSPPPYTDSTAIKKWNRQTQTFGEPCIYFEGFGWIPSTPSALAPDESALFTISTPFTARGPFAGLLGGSPVPTRRPSSVMIQPQRIGTNFTFQWASASNANYAVFASTNLNTVQWRLVQAGVATPANGLAAVTVSGQDQRVFYRLQPNLALSPAPVLLGGTRRSNQFSFQFYAPAATNYIVERGPTFPSGPWQIVTNLTAGPSNIVGVADRAATANTAYYRVRYGQ